jgi:hypothetical protein
MDGTDTLSLESLQEVERILFANPTDQAAIRRLAEMVRLIGEHVIRLEDQWDQFNVHQLK